MASPVPFEPGEDLSRFRYHTGAALRPLAPDEPCRVLFRDIGPRAMVDFLGGRLKRLTGPYAPILYTRTADYHEPYTDAEPIGRLVFLQPMRLRPWYSGVSDIFVASLRQPFDPRTIGFVPAHFDLRDAENKLRGVESSDALRETLGGGSYDECILETVESLKGLNAEHDETERWAEPMRRRLQSSSRAESDAAKEWLRERGLNESDLCAAWHHLPRARRTLLRDALRERPEGARC